MVRYAFGGTGLILAGAGIYALLVFSGQLQAILSSLIVVGLVTIMASLMRFERKRITFELVLAVLGVITLPYVVATEGVSTTHPSAACTNGLFAHRKIPVNWNKYHTDNAAKFSVIDGSHLISYPQLRWAGYYIPLPNELCNYTISFFAKERRPSRPPRVGTGWGYGLGVCDTINTADPSGFSMQYAFFQQTHRLTLGGFEAVNLPRANTFPNGTAQGMPYPLDYRRHQWTLTVSHNQVQVIFDDDYKIDQADLIGAGLPNDCKSSGVFLRAWGGTVQFSDFTVSTPK